MNGAVFGVLCAEDFYHYPHRVVCDIALSLWRAFETVGLVEVYADLKRRGVLADLGPSPAGWLAELYEEDPTGAWCGWAAERVRELAARREAIRSHRLAADRLLRGEPVTV